MNITEREKTVSKMKFYFVWGGTIMEKILEIIEEKLENKIKEFEKSSKERILRLAKELGIEGGEIVYIADSLGYEYSRELDSTTSAKFTKLIREFIKRYNSVSTDRKLLPPPSDLEFKNVTITIRETKLNEKVEENFSTFEDKSVDRLLYSFTYVMPYEFENVKYAIIVIFDVERSFKEEIEECLE